MVNIKRPCAVVVFAHVSCKERKPAPLPVIAASVFNRSRVDRATIEAREHQHVALVDRVDRAAQLGAVTPRTARVSRKTFSAPAARSCFTCAPTLWPSVETRA